MVPDEVVFYALDGSDNSEFTMKVNLFGHTYHLSDKQYVAKNQHTRLIYSLAR